MHYYTFHPGDHTLHTAHLTLAEDATYRRALDLYFVSEAPLENDKRSLSKRLRVDEKTLSAVLEEFFMLREDGWHHAGCDAEIAKYQAKSAKAKLAGSLGGRARKKRMKSVRPASAKRTLSERQANQEPVTRNQSTPLSPQGGGEEGLEDQALKNPAMEPTRWTPTPEQLQVSGWFSRRPSTPWSRKELRAWKGISFEPEDMKILDWLYLRSGYAYLRNDLRTLLNNWRGEVERARRFADKEDQR